MFLSKQYINYKEEELLQVQNKIMDITTPVLVIQPNPEKEVKEAIEKVKQHPKVKETTSDYDMLRQAYVILLGDEYKDTAEETIVLPNSTYADIDKNLLERKIRALNSKVNASVLADGLMAEIKEYDIDVYTMDILLGQMAVESGLNYKRVESTYYNPSRMIQIFGKYHPDVKRNPSKYARNPQALANYVYANRMGNGPPSSGDGYRYRGRGLIQLTGKSQYREMTKAHTKRYGGYVDFVKIPNLVTDPKYSVRIAFLYFDKARIPQLVSKLFMQGKSDTDIILAVTKKINGGANGLMERVASYKKVSNFNSIA